MGAPKIGVGGQRIEGQKCAIFFVPERMHIWRSARTCLHATIDNKSSKKIRSDVNTNFFRLFFYTSITHNAYLTD